jgi:hypothetical protein
MRKIFNIGVALFCFIEHAEAQKIDGDLLIDSIKSDITQFFIKEGLLDKQKVKDSRNYVFATEIKQKRSIGYDTNGIYRVGVYQSHSPEHILIKQKNEFRIFNLKEMSKVIKEVVCYSEKNNVGVEMMLVYVKEVMEMYQNNYNTGNFKLRKMK